MLRKKTQHMFSVTSSWWKVGGRTSVAEREQIQGKGMSQDLKNESFQLFYKYVTIKACIPKTEFHTFFYSFSFIFFLKEIIS